MNKRPFREKIHSLSLGARIVWVFVFIAIFSTFIFGGAFKLLTKDNERHVLPKIVSDYGNSLVKELGEPAQLDKAHIIAQRTGMEIYIQTANSIVSTSKKSLLKGLFEGEKHLTMQHQGLTFNVQFYHGTAYMQAIKPKEAITFVVSFRHSSIQKGLVFISFILSMILIIYIAYRLVRYLISPIQDIKQGVAEFAQGNLCYRIEKKRNDDLGALTVQINQMASQLDSIIEAKRQLLLAISHELRTPMTRIKIALDLPFNNKNKLRLNNSLNQMEKLLAELLETEKLSNQQQTLAFQQTDINELLSNLIDEEYTENDQIKLNLTQQNTSTNADTMRLRLLFRNLIGNAIKYGNNETITISTTVKNNHLSITVKDTGEGIAEKNLSNVFEAFYREDPSRQRQTGGTGMGLYLAKLIVNAHQGKINIISKKGKGTEVLVTLALG